MKVGESSTVNFYSYNMQGLAGAEFEVEYDSALLALDSITLGSKLTEAADAVYSINDESPGYVKISYATLPIISIIQYSEAIVTINKKIARI